MTDHEQLLINLLDDLESLANTFKQRWHTPNYPSKSHTQFQKDLREAAEAVWIEAEEEIRNLIRQHKDQP